MDEQRTQAYLAIINELLNYGHGQEVQVLNQYPELLDRGLVEVMGHATQVLQNQGRDNDARFLLNIAQQLAEWLNAQESVSNVSQPHNTDEDYVQFAIKVLQATSDSDGDPRVIYPLLEKNLDKLDLNFADTLRNSGTRILSQIDYRQAIKIAIAFGNFGNIIQEFTSGDRENNLDIALVCYEVIFIIFAKEKAPEFWARNHTNIGLVYGKRQRGGYAYNREKEIESYTAALQVYSVKYFTEEWAETQSDLANAYANRVQGDRAENLEIAISCYQAALQVYTRETDPKKWAMIQHNMGLEYCNRIRGERAENLEIAIAYLYDALQVYTHEAFPEQWSMTQNALGTAYGQRIRGERRQNLEMAIFHFHAALQVVTHENFPATWADIYNNLGVTYTERIQGEKAENLEIAIACCEKALAVFTRQSSPQGWADLQINLGNIYKQRIRGNRADNLEIAITYYQTALAIYSLEAFPQKWASLQHNMGSAYLERIRGERSENIESAIDCCNAALQVYTCEAFPHKWAGVQSKLGDIYSSRIRGKKADNLERAIICYKDALHIFTCEAFPQDWATVQINLGSVYGKRIREGQAQNLEIAISYYMAGLRVLTYEAFPEEWASTQISLGNAYSDRILGKQEENREKALAYYQAALNVYTYETFPENWARVQGGLGNLYSEGISKKKADHLGSDSKKAISYYQAALEVFTRETFPEQWAAIQNNLGSTYCKYARGEKAENIDIEQAIFCHQEALQVSTREAFPEQWAMVQNNLGAAYSERIKGEPEENFKQTISAYRKALEIYTRANYPQDNIRTLNNLRLIYQAQSRHYSSNPEKRKTALQNAYITLEEAIETVEYLRGEIISGDEAKRKLNENWDQLYRNIVEVCLELGKLTTAIEYADRSKARNLVELIATRDAYPQGEIPLNIRQRLQQLRLEIDQENRRLAEERNTNQKPDYTYINQLRQEFQTKYPYKPLKFNQMQHLLNSETAILEWYIAGDTWVTFILTPDNLYLWKSKCGKEQLINNLATYLAHYRGDKKEWQTTLFQYLEILSETLQLDDVVETLFQRFPSCKKLILIPHLFLHLLPLHALPIHGDGGEGKPLQDLFAQGVTYAPNCQLLQQAQNRPRPNFNHLFAIQNPTQDLKFTDIEVAVIQDYFTPKNVLKHQEAEKIALDFTNAHCTHFSCHGYFNTDDPLKSALILANSELLPPPPHEDATRYLPLKNGNLLDLSKCLTLEDILQLDLSQCRLVTLSACETGQVALDTSDEYIGLPSGFILAGSPNVVSSLWAVNDLSTALLMIRFYQNVKKGQTIALALQYAQKWLREATVEELLHWSNELNLRPTHKHQFKTLKKMDTTAQPFASPYYWAAFCAIGG